MNHQSNTFQSTSLEEQLKTKLEQFYKAEAEGRSKPELSMLYRELKELNFQLTCSKSRVRYGG